MKELFNRRVTVLLPSGSRMFGTIVSVGPTHMRILVGKRICSVSRKIPVVDRFDNTVVYNKGCLRVDD